MTQPKKLTTDRAVHWGLGIGAVLIIVAIAWVVAPVRFIIDFFTVAGG